ncbi:hypothetical protein Bca52824_009442 [Brassica carinata]|uniref:protein-serine/threonine phosphatase n=1 Tax=Brassica carinata TaxID=52824 RepID=A0A8X7W9X9_BRACI|nr:hypothetical protein Bca52824_009442 [Brassica carinata]
MSGPIESATSGPLDPAGEISRSNSAGVHFSARRRLLEEEAEEEEEEESRGIRFSGRGTAAENTVSPDGGEAAAEAASAGENELQWALGKAGEDRVQLAVFEKQGWLFAGIYDGFNGPDAPEFLMANLYRAVHSELQGLFWELEEEEEDEKGDNRLDSSTTELASSSKSPSEVVEVKERKHGLDLSGSDRFAFSVDDVITGGNAVSVGSKRWLFLSKLKRGLSKQGVSSEAEVVDSVRVEETVEKRKKRRKVGTVDHELVLKAMSNGLEATEQAFLEMTDKVLDTNPELALMGSCLLVALMRDDDVYIMNIGDSRALVAQHEVKETGGVDSDIKEPSAVDDNETCAQGTKLVALQLTTDHSTSIEDEVTRIKNEHPDDMHCIVNDRVKGRLKVTRAFGAGFLKQPKLNDALLEMFRNEYIGTDPYISCTPSLRHYRLTENDQFMVLSSDGLYQYLSNEEVVSLAMEKFQMEILLNMLYRNFLSVQLSCLVINDCWKTGLGFHELLDIPQGDRRKYHDDCTVLVIALGGSRIWKSSGKYL